MRSVLGLLLVVLLSGSLACATPSPPVQSEASAEPWFFWETEHDGARLALLGSVHIGDGRRLHLDPAVYEALTAADELVVEVDMDRLPEREALAIMERHGLLPPGETLTDRLDPELYDRAVVAMLGHGFPRSMTDRMRPWFIAQMITYMEFQAAGYDPSNGVDLHFLRVARRQGTPVTTLETFDEQLAMLAELPPDLQLEMLEESLDDAAHFMGLVREMFEAWENGDEQALLELFAGEVDADPRRGPLYERILFDRNHTMTARLVELCRDGRSRFAVVGVGHLIGPRGIPALLAAQGFEVRRVPGARVRVLGRRATR